MYHNYDKAVGMIKDYLTNKQFSTSVIYSHLHCYKKLKEYLEEKQSFYSHREAIFWLKLKQVHWKHSKFKMFRLAIFRLDDIVTNGEITKENYIYENSYAYQKLPIWYKSLLDEFLQHLAESFGKGYVTQHRISCSSFLIYFSDIGINSISDIRHQDIIRFYKQSNHKTIQAHNLYNRCIRHFLKYLFDKDILSQSLTYILDRFVIPKVVFIDSFSKIKKENYLNESKDNSSIPAIEFYSIAKKLANIYLEHHKYSLSMKKVFYKIWKDFYVFLEANNLNYTYILAEKWCKYLKSENIQWKSSRRSFKLLEQFRLYGDINPKVVFSYKDDAIVKLPEWCRGLLSDFLKKKHKEEFSESTISMYRSSCLRLLNFLIKKNITSFTLITPYLIKEFHNSAIHSTPEGRNAYSSRIRGFLDYLSDNGYVADTLKLSLTAECAQKTKIVEILRNDEIKTIYRYRENSKKAMELRNISIVLIGLRLGLRAIDISNIKLTDISWKEGVISIQQQKTNVFLKLPIPVDVGNSVYNYITNGRPSTTSDYVFISHRVPFDKLNRTCCNRALKKVLGNKNRSFHITRKTFASLMLKKEISVETIADVLGHSTLLTVHKYLSTDNKIMRKCALSLEGIEVKRGGLL